MVDKKRPVDEASKILQEERATLDEKEKAKLLGDSEGGASKLQQRRDDAVPILEANKKTALQVGFSACVIMRIQYKYVSIK